MLPGSHGFQSLLYKQNSLCCWILMNTLHAWPYLVSCLCSLILPLLFQGFIKYQHLGIKAFKLYYNWQWFSFLVIHSTKTRASICPKNVNFKLSWNRCTKYSCTLQKCSGAVFWINTINGFLNVEENRKQGTERKGRVISHLHHFANQNHKNKHKTDIVWNTEIKLHIQSVYRPHHKPDFPDRKIYIFKQWSQWDTDSRGKEFHNFWAATKNVSLRMN